MRTNRIKLIAPRLGLMAGESGQALVEYALVLSLVSLVCVGTLALFGAPLNAIFNAVAAGF